MPLGCSSVDAAIVARGDWTQPLAVVSLQSANGGGDMISAQFDRRLNDISTGEMVLANCYKGIEIVPWEHALLFAWDGAYVWGGPITGVKDDSDGNGVITAQDIMVWMRFRKIRDLIDTIGAPDDITDIFVQLISDGFDQDPSVAYSIISSATGVTAERRYTPGHAGLVYDAADELVNTGIDFTVLLDVITCGGLEISTTPIGVLNSSHLRNKPIVDNDGMEQGNFITKIGSGRGYEDDALTGLAQDAGSQTTYGLLDRIEDVPEIEDQTSLDQAADTSLALRSGSPLLVSELILGPDAPLSHTDIVPGAVLDTWLDGRFKPYIGNLRLESAQFVAEGGMWVPKLNAQPVGTT